jgi:pullulanase/glycogen debranching enzyme
MAPFLRGEDGVTGRFADSVIGSPSLYDHKQREPEASVNFVYRTGPRSVVMLFAALR